MGLFNIKIVVYEFSFENVNMLQLRRKCASHETEYFLNCPVWEFTLMLKMNLDSYITCTWLMAQFVQSSYVLNSFAFVKTSLFLSKALMQIAYFQSNILSCSLCHLLEMHQFQNKTSQRVTSEYVSQCTVVISNKNRMNVIFTQLHCFNGFLYICKTHVSNLQQNENAGLFSETFSNMQVNAKVERLAQHY